MKTHEELNHELEKLRIVLFALEGIREDAQEMKKACLEDNIDVAESYATGILVESDLYVNVLHDIVSSLESIVEGKAR